MLSSLDVVVAALLSPSSTFENAVAFALLCSVDACVVLPNALVMVALLLLLLCDFAELPKLMSELSTHTHIHTHTCSDIACEAKFKSSLSRLPAQRSLVYLNCAVSLSRVVRKLLRQKQLKRPSSSSSSTLTSQFIFSVRSMRFSSSSSVVVRSASSSSLTLLLTVVLIVLPRTL